MFDVDEETLFLTRNFFLITMTLHFQTANLEAHVDQPTAKRRRLEGNKFVSLLESAGVKVDLEAVDDDMEGSMTRPSIFSHLSASSMDKFRSNFQSLLDKMTDQGRNKVVSGENVSSVYEEAFGIRV